MGGQMRGVVDRLICAAVRLQVEGREHLPAAGPVLLASNHLSVVDSKFLPLAVRRPVTFMAKAEYFDGGPRRRDQRTAQMMRERGQIPVQRDNPRAAVAALDECRAVLERGDVLAIYPEGTRSPDGRLYRGRTGVAWLAMSVGAPVLPVALSGTDRVHRRGQRLPRVARVRVAFGAPLDFSEFAGRQGDARTRRLVTDRIVAAIGGLSGQQYVPSYACAPVALRVGASGPR